MIVDLLVGSVIFAVLGKAGIWTAGIGSAGKYEALMMGLFGYILARAALSAGIPEVWWVSLVSFNIPMTLSALGAVLVALAFSFVRPVVLRLSPVKH